MTMLPAPMQQRRALLGARYLRGSGIEIGALDCAMPVPESARVRYVDRVSVAELRRYYPELQDHVLVEPDVIDNGETLESIADDSLDFIIANHMLEHCENPLGTLRVHLRRLRRGGILFYSIPDKRQCFDEERPLTPFAHLLADEADGGAQSRWPHYLEWATHVNKLADPDAAAHNARENMRSAYSIHFHVWDPDSFRQFLAAAASHLDHAYALEHFETSGSEIISVLKKR